MDKSASAADAIKTLQVKRQDVRGLRARTGNQSWVGKAQGYICKPIVTP
jgi:hypothetical protein